MDEFFENRTPRQRLGQAKREFQKLQNDLTNDNISHFFVAAYHIIDSIEIIGTVPDEDIRELRSNPDFRKCRYVCNKIKHPVLTKSPDDEFKTYRRPAAICGQIRFNEVPCNSTLAYFIIDENEQVGVLELGQRIIDLWEKFFSEHNI